MKVTIHAEGNLDEIAEQLREAAEVYGPSKCCPSIKDKAPEAPKKNEKPAKGGKASKPVETEEATDDEETFEDATDTEEVTEEGVAEEFEDSEEEKEEEGLSLDKDIIPGFKKYAAKNGREKAAAILAKFKCKSVQNLKPADFEKVLKMLKGK